MAGSGAQGHLAEHLLPHLPHLSLLALHNQQLTQLTIQLKESLEDSQCTIKELKQENEALRQGVNENVRNEIAQLRMEKEKEMKTLEASLRQVAMAESESLKQEVAELRRLEEEDRASLETVQRYTGVFPVKLMMTNFAEIKRSDGEWYSPPFYTHPPQYPGFIPLSDSILVVQEEESQSENLFCILMNVIFGGGRLFTSRIGKISIVIEDYLGS